MSKSKIFFVLLIYFILGVVLKSYFDLPLFAAYVVFLLCSAVLILFWKNTIVRVAALGGILLFLGILRYQIALPKTDAGQISFYNGQEITFIGLVNQPPDVRLNQTKLTVKAEKLLVKYDIQPISGLVLVTAPLYPEYHYGDRLEIGGRLNQPEPIEDFAYDRYLGRYNINSLVYYSQIEIKQTGQGNKIYAAVLSFKNKLQQAINSSLPGEQAGLLSAMTLGYRRGVSDELLDKFSRTSTTHIMAISGLHITIISTVLMIMLIALGLSRHKAFYISLTILALYILMIGWPASALRAGLMSLLLLWAMKEGRLGRALNAVVFAAVVILLFNPKLLRDDLGFQLSFLAVLGIIFVYPLLDKVLAKISQDKLGIKSAAQMTLAAQSLTLPLIVLSFGRLSLVGPLANILILPLMPAVMMSGLAVSLISLCYLDLGRILFWPVWLLLTYIIKVVEILASFNFSSLAIQNISGWLIIIIYLVIGFLIRQLKRRTIKY